MMQKTIPILVLFAVAVACSADERAVTQGANPVFSPDGTSIVYDRDGTIFVRPFVPDEEPDTLLPNIRDDAAPALPEATPSTPLKSASVGRPGPHRRRKNRLRRPDHSC